MESSELRIEELKRALDKNEGKHSSLKERAGVKPGLSWGYACWLLFLGRRD